MSEMSYRPAQQQSQSMILSQQQLQSLKMLELTAQELDEFLQIEFTENPALEWNSSRRKPSASASSSSSSSSAARDPISYEASCEMYSAEEQWKTNLLDQVQRQPAFLRSPRVFLTLIKWADSDGLFRTPIEEFCDETGIPLHEAASCLEMLRDLDPPGVFAADTPHCLLKQAEKRGRLDSTLSAIILHHLSEVASGYYAKMAAELHLSRRKLGQYIELIKELSPYPLNGLASADETHYVVPDITLHQQEGHWEIVLNDHSADSYCLSPYCTSLYRQADSPELHAYLKQSLERARLIINSINQRRETVFRLTEAIVRIQQAWLEHRGPLMPMTMGQLAAQLEISPSTVSRAVKGKYIETPTRGTVAMRSLFSQEVAVGDGSMNADEVQKQLRSLIEREEKDAPYSDQKLAALLEAKNIFISRRTVAKYRQEMLIPSAYARREP